MQATPDNHMVDKAGDALGDATATSATPDVTAVKHVSQIACTQSLQFIHLAIVRPIVVC